MPGFANRIPLMCTFLEMRLSNIPRDVMDGFGTDEDAIYSAEEGCQSQ